jgi:RHS repeat-associated protein
MKANGATPVSYGYDAASRLTQVAQAGLVVGLGYDNANRRTSLTYPNGTSTTYSYDNASRLTSIAHNGPSGVIESLSYVYDAAGNRISLTRTNGTASNLPAAVQAAYDAANQQIQFNSASPNQTFDANGNLTGETGPTGTTTYTWDARNRLVAQAGPGMNATFQYDALGRRVSKTVNGQTTGYLYDGNDIVQEIGGSAVGASYVRSLNIDEPFVRQSATGNEFYHVDALGSTLDLTNQAGAVQASYHYEAFGKTTMTGTSSNPFQYTGRENDRTGLYYYRARYYGPISGRFASEDPMRSSSGGEQNLYLYVLNSPTNFDDPRGKFPRGFGRPVGPPFNPFHYGNYCGRGSRGGEPIDELDRACHDHDNCYGKIGLEGFDAFFPPSDPKKCSQKDKCDEELCSKARSFTPRTYRSEEAKTWVVRIFCKS